MGLMLVKLVEAQSPLLVWCRSSERGVPVQIVRVQYFVRGGFLGHRSRASSKHLSSRLPVDGASFLGGQKGLRCSCKMQVWVSGPTKMPTTLDVRRTARGRLETEHVILNHGQVTWTTPELAPSSPNYHTSGRSFQLSTDLTCIAALHGGSLVVLGSNS
ncbi:hypothetical protein TNCV_4368881 [Trichonephila clavipes]|nr:hypothetical protein TNCV_4368881 [Trichonephila clavipes]